MMTLATGVMLAAGVLGLSNSGRASAQTACPPTPVPSPSPTPGPPPPGTSVDVCYPPGWNLAGGPTHFPVPLWEWDPVAGKYNQLPPGPQLPFPPGPTGETNGQGAWAYFAQTTDVSFSVPVPFGFPVSAPLAAGQWQQIGNPFNDSQAIVCGAGVSVSIYTYDPVAGAYGQNTTLKLGQGAWAYAAAGGTLTLVALAANGPAGPCPSP